MPAWGGFIGGSIPRSALIMVRGFLCSPRFAPRLAWALRYFDQHKGPGDYWAINEVYRPQGALSDINIGRYRGDMRTTSTGGSNVCYQWGRHLLWLDTGGREGTPSAANPYVIGSSEHSWADASDGSTNNPALRAEACRLAGLRFTIPSESWHTDDSGTPLVDFSDLGDLLAGIGTSIAEKDWFDMATSADLDAAVLNGSNSVIKALRPSAPIFGWNMNNTTPASGPIAIFGADFVEAGVNEPERKGKRGRRVFASPEEYETFKTICDTINQHGGLAPVLPELNEVVFLDINAWTTFNSFYQEP